MTSNFPSVFVINSALTKGHKDNAYKDFTYNITHKLNIGEIGYNDIT